MLPVAVIAVEYMLMKLALLCCHYNALPAGIQVWDRWRTKRAQAGAAGAALPWEGKGGLLYHIDLGLDLVIRVCRIVHAVNPAAAVQILNLWQV